MLENNFSFLVGQNPIVHIGITPEGIVSIGLDPRRGLVKENLNRVRNYIPSRKQFIIFISNQDLRNMIRRIIVLGQEYNIPQQYQFSGGGVLDPVEWDLKKFKVDRLQGFQIRSNARFFASEIWMDFYKIDVIGPDSHWHGIRIYDVQANLVIQGSPPSLGLANASIRDWRDRSDLRIDWILDVLGRKDDITRMINGMLQSRVINLVNTRFNTNWGRVTIDSLHPRTNEIGLSGVLR